MKRLLLVVLLLCGAAAIGTQACVTTGDGQGVEALEAMSETEFAKWKLYIQLGVKIGANRLLEEGVVSADELEIAATAIETVRDQNLQPGATSFIQDALKDNGLTNDEVEFVLLVVEQEILARSGLEFNPDTGLVTLTLRTKDVLTVVAEALRSATLVTDEEQEAGLRLEREFQSGMILND